MKDFDWRTRDPAVELPDPGVGGSVFPEGRNVWKYRFRGKAVQAGSDTVRVVVDAVFDAPTREPIRGGKILEAPGAERPRGDVNSKE